MRLSEFEDVFKIIFGPVSANVSLSFKITCKCIFIRHKPV